MCNATDRRKVSKSHTRHASVLSLPCKSHRNEVALDPYLLQLRLLDTDNAGQACIVALQRLHLSLVAGNFRRPCDRSVASMQGAESTLPRDAWQLHRGSRRGTATPFSASRSGRRWTHRAGPAAEKLRADVLAVATFSVCLLVWRRAASRAAVQNEESTSHTRDPIS